MTIISDNDSMINIFSFLECSDLFRCFQVNKEWYSVTMMHDQLVWKTSYHYMLKNLSLVVDSGEKDRACPKKLIWYNLSKFKSQLQRTLMYGCTPIQWNCDTTGYSMNSSWSRVQWEAIESLVFNMRRMDNGCVFWKRHWTRFTDGNLFVMSCTVNVFSSTVYELVIFTNDRMVRLWVTREYEQDVFDDEWPSYSISFSENDFDNILSLNQRKMVWKKDSSIDFDNAQHLATVFQFSDSKPVRSLLICLFEMLGFDKSYAKEVLSDNLII